MFWQQKPPPRQVQRTYSGTLQYFCDACHETIDCVYGSDQRYHCSECQDVDFCGRCAGKNKMRCMFAEGKAAAEHVLMREYGERQHLIEMANNCGEGVGAKAWAMFHYFETRPMIGRRVELPPGDSRGPVTYQYETYGEIRARIAPLAWQLVELGKKYDAEAARRAHAMSQMPDAHGFVTGLPANTGTGRPFPPRISIMLENCPAWLLFDLAAAVAGCASSPLDSSATPEIMRHIMGMAEPFCVLVGSFDKAREIRAATRDMYAKAGITLTVIVADFDLNGTQSYPTGLTQAQIAAELQASTPREPLTTLSAFAAPGPAYDPAVYCRGTQPDQRDKLAAHFPVRRSTDLFTLFTTSGSTGLPKCAAVDNSNFAAASFGIGRHDRRDNLCFTIYRPLSYATDRDLSWRGFGSAGRLAILEPPVERWLFGGELAAAKPSSFSAPPRIFNEVFQRFQRERNEIEARFAKAKEGGGNDGGGAAADAAAAADEGWKAWIMSPKDDEIKKLWQKYTALVGPRCTAITTGSAPVSPETFAWMNECYRLRGNTTVFESMGTTECGGVLTNGKVAYGSEVRLIPIEGDESAQASGYNLLPDGRLRRGEFICRNDTMITGYFANADATNKLFWIDPKDKTRWIRTGDIGTYDPIKDMYEVVGRISCSVKLSNGVFCNPETVETIYQKHLAVKDVAVYAESGWNCCLAVVCLNDRARENGIARPDDADTVCAALRQFAVAEEGVPVNLLPAAVLLVPPFSREDGTLTISQKVARPGIKTLYAAKLKAIHDRLAARGSQDDKAAGGDDSHGSGGMEVSESGMIMMPTMVDPLTGAVRHRHKALAGPRFLVLHAFREVLRGIADIPRDVRSTAVDAATAVSLGADSVMIGSLREKIGSNSGVTFDLRQFGMMPIRQIIARVEAQQTGVPYDENAGGFPSADGSANGATQQASLEQLRRMLARDTAIAAPLAAGAVGSAPRRGTNTFTTGATGFIGIHVLAQLLLQRPDATHFAMVRAPNAMAAAQRLQQAAAGYRLPFVADAVADGRIRVVRGDLVCGESSSEPLPLELADVPKHSDSSNAAQAKATAVAFDASNWAETVATVYALGANVNHVLPYENLSGPNVRANERLMRAFASPAFEPPAVVYASSASVCGPAYLDGPGGSEAQCRAELGDDALRSAMARGGYVLSKYASERLVRAMAGGGLAHPQRSRIVRIGMCSWSSETGACNTNDWLVSLTLAVALVKENPFTTFNMGLVPVLWLASELVKDGRGASSGGGELEVQDRGESLRIDMSSMVWEKLAAEKPQQPTQGKISWSAFTQKLAALGRPAFDGDGGNETARRVANRLELLYGGRLPQADGGAPDRPNNAGDVLGIGAFCDFVKSQ